MESKETKTGRTGQGSASGRSSPGSKLKTETSAKKASGRKLQAEKASQVSAGEKLRHDKAVFDTESDIVKKRSKRCEECRIRSKSRQEDSIFPESRDPGIRSAASPRR